MADDAADDVLRVSTSIVQTDVSVDALRATTIGWWSLRAVLERSTSPRETISLSTLGISMPIADLPGMGLRIRTSAEATAYAMFFDSAVTFSTFTAGPSSTS